MITRIWHGWTTRANADAYQQLLTTEILPAIHRVPGYKGAGLLRRDSRDARNVPGAEMLDEVEFVTITRFDSMDSVRAFAGPDYETAVVPPAARKLLTRFDQRSQHFQTVFLPE